MVLLCSMMSLSFPRRSEHPCAKSRADRESSVFNVSVISCLWIPRSSRGMTYRILFMQESIVEELRGQCGPCFFRGVLSVLYALRYDISNGYSRCGLLGRTVICGYAGAPFKKEKCYHGSNYYRYDTVFSQTQFSPVTTCIISIFYTFIYNSPSSCKRK